MVAHEEEVPVSINASPKEAPRAPAVGELARGWNYKVEKFSGDAARNEAIGSRAIAVNAAFREPLDQDLLWAIDKKLVDLHDTSPEKGQTRSTGDNQVYVELMNGLRGGEFAQGAKPRSLDSIFSNLGKDGIEAQAQLRALRTFAEGMRMRANETHDRVFQRVADLTRLRVEMAEAEIILKDPRYSSEKRQKVAQLYPDRWRKYAATDDIPGRFKNRFATVADQLEKYRPAEQPPAPQVTPEPPSSAPSAAPRAVAKKITIEDIAPVSREQAINARLEGVGIAVKLEHDPSHKLFGKENPLKADDLRRIQGKIEELTLVGNPKNAFEVAKLAAHLKRAGVRIVDGHEQLGTYLQRQRAAMLVHGPRALAQYLTYGKYAGFVNELSPQEHKYLLDCIQQRLLDNQGPTGLTRLAMNARYLGVSDYNPDSVREGILKEIEALKSAGRTEDAAAEAARARQAGIDPSAVFTIEGNFTANLEGKLAAHASAGRWDVYARLRNNLDVALRHSWLLDKQISGLIGHFAAARERAHKNGQWDAYTEYAAHVRELSNREGKRRRGESVAPVTPTPRPRSIGGPEPTRTSQEEVLAEAVEAPPVAQSAQERLEEWREQGGDIGASVLRPLFDRYKTSDPARETGRQRYLDIMEDELVYLDSLKEGGLLNRLTSLWTEPLYAQIMINPTKPWRWLTRQGHNDMRQAREDVITSLRTALDDPASGLDEAQRALFSELAARYEELQRRERGSVQSIGELLDRDGNAVTSVRGTEARRRTDEETPTTAA